MASVDILLPGFPVRTSRGAIAYSSVVLVKSDQGPRMLVDCGHYADRSQLFRSLEARQLRLQDIDILVLTHLHFDHCINARFFQWSTVLVSREEIRYAESPAPHDFFVADNWRSMLDNLSTHLVSGEEILTDDIRLIRTPGHTPGSISVVASTSRGVYAITSDTAKNVRELVTKDFSLRACTPEVCASSTDRILRMANYIIPGHDQELKVSDGHICFNELDLTYSITLQVY